MPRATKEELEWAYAVTREKFLERVNKMFPIKTDDWNRYLDGIFELISNDEAPLYESKMNAYFVCFIDLRYNKAYRQLR